MGRRFESSSLDEHQIEELENLLKSEGLPSLIDSFGNRTELPKPIFEMLSDIVQHVKQGHSIFMISEDETFTTQAAANFLVVSRQHLVDLLEKGEIDFHYVGTHRRVYFRDLKKYADKRDRKRKETLDELFDKVTDTGKYNASYQGDDS
ncbi:excisionase family DNA-binding protein [Fodinibius sp. SL11]|uniref:excisionase family DNA-binding protein n=1 Tax=Fodinibius sp. SL11 TaxID=3425690 RepID=UPI003F880DE7